LLAEAQNLVHTVVLRWRGAKNIGITVFFCSENVKNRENTAYLTLFGVCKTCRFDDFGGFAKRPTTKITTTTTTGPSSNSYNNNNNNDDDDADDDDDNNDNDDNDDNEDSYLVQIPENRCRHIDQK